MAGNKSPIPWVGNKGCIYSVIDAFMPPHRVYLEACAGSAEVFFRKRKSGKEILNDYNGDLAHFFRVLQSSEKLALLIGRLYLSFSSEELFRANKQLLASIPNVLDDLNETVQAIDEFTWEDINRAAAFLENQVFSFSSLGEVFAIAEKDMTARFKRLITASCRLREAIILHRDYKDAIAFAAERGTFILLDPPYLGTEDYYTKSKFDKNEHERLFRFMYEIHKTYEGECKFLITYNNDPLLQDMYSVYEQKTIYRDELRQKSKSDISRIVEEINDGTYTNYQLEAMLTELAKRLKNVNGKKVYGYLPADIKQMVDSIVDELQGQEEIAKLYDLWYQQKEEILKNYVDNLPPRVALSENKEFVAIKNAVISGALHILGEDKEYPVPKTRKTTLKVSPDNQENVRAFTQLATRESASYLVSSIVNMLRDYNFRKPEEDEKISVPKTDKRKHKKKHSHGLSL